MGRRLRVSVFIILAAISLSGCRQSGALESPRVSFGMDARLNGEALPPLVGMTAESCFDGYGRYVITFSATADLEPQAIDDEIGLLLQITFLDDTRITLGRPINVASNPYVKVSTSLSAFVDPAALGLLTGATGTINISKLTYHEMSGAVSLTFRDTDDINVLVDDTLAYDLKFSNLAIERYCPEGLVFIRR